MDIKTTGPTSACLYAVADNSLPLVVKDGSDRGFLSTVARLEKKNKAFYPDAGATDAIKGGSAASVLAA